MKKLTLAALGIVALATLPASAANWSETYLGWQYSSQFREPGLVGTINKNRLEFNHVSGWDYGTNFFDVNMLASSSKDPANNSTGQPQAGVPGATEVYCLYRGSFNLGKIFKTDMSFGPVREVDFTVGFDFDSKDNQFASNKKFIMAGPQFGFKIDKGFWNLGIAACRELNWSNSYGTVNTTDGVHFKTTFMVFTSWDKNFDIGVPVQWKGWANYIGEKGKDAFNNDTAPETVMNTYLMVDASSLFGRKKGAIQVGPGFEYWNNKFGGKNATAPAGSPWLNNERVTAALIGVEFHF